MKRYAKVLVAFLLLTTACATRVTKNDYQNFSLFTISYPYMLNRFGQMNIKYNGESYSLILPEYVMSKPVGVVSGYFSNDQINFSYEVPPDGEQMSLRYPMYLNKFTYNNRQVRLNFVDMLGENIINPFESSAAGSIYNKKGAKSNFENCTIDYNNIECVPSSYVCVDQQSYSIVF